MSLYQNANQGRHGTLAIFFRENMPGFYFTIWSVFIGHWTPPWNCFLSYNPRELCFACQLKHFTDLNFLGHYNSFFFFFQRLRLKTGLSFCFSKCSLFLEKHVLYMMWGYLDHSTKWTVPQNGWMRLNQHLFPSVTWVKKLLGQCGLSQCFYRLHKENVVGLCLVGVEHLQSCH